MFFLAFSNVNVSFADNDLIWKTYIIDKALPTTKRIQIINRKEFAKATLDPNQKVFVVHVATLTSEMTIHLFCQAQITLLKAEKSPFTVPAQYSDFADVFSEKFAVVLPKHPKIKTYAIELKEDKQPPYGSIYNLGLVELETLKIYIETKLVNDFIYLSKSPAGALILFK